MNIHQFFNEIPKTELHLHLDGAFTHDFLFSLIEKYDADPSIKSVEHLAVFWETTHANFFAIQVSHNTQPPVADDGDRGGISLHGYDLNRW